MITSQTSMTPNKFRNEITAISREMGARAEIYASISSARFRDEATISAHVYVQGMGQNMTFSVSGETFDLVVPSLRAKWDEHKAEHERQFTRKIAIKIIEITALIGECTDAALRDANFTDEDISRFGERACADANDIAGRGPFTLRKLRSGNGAPAVSDSATQPAA